MNMVENQKNETPREFAERVVRNAKVDIDLDYCEKRGLKYKNHEIDASSVELFNSASTKAAFDLVTRLFD